MTSKIIVNNIESDVGISSVTFNDTISGNLEGNINSSGTSTFNVISGVSTIGVTTVHLTGINDLSYPTAGPLSHRNMCINGAMQVVQRGTSSTGQTTGGYKTVDRFYNGISNVGTWTISQSTDAPAGFSNSLKYECTTASASLNAAAQLYYVQKIEAQNLQQLSYGSSDAKECTFSFYFKTNKTGVYTVEIFQNASSKSISFPMGVSQTGWQRYEFVVPGDTAGTINNDSGVGLWCFLWLAGGSNYTSGTFNNGTWATNVHANRLSSSQVNFADSTSNECFLTGVQLETGSVATPFEYRSYADELARCLRYYWSQNVADSASDYGAFSLLSAYSTSTDVRGMINFPVPMRILPSLDHTQISDFAHLGGAAPSDILIADGGSNVFNCGIRVTLSGNQTANYASILRANNNQNAEIMWDAEL